MKKITTLVFLLAICLFAYGERVKIGNLYYNLDDKNLTAEVTYEYYMTQNNYEKIEGDPLIPENLDYGNKHYTVTAIGEFAFSDCSGLGPVRLPETIQTIGFCAFARCHDLFSIYIPASVTDIGFFAFEHCFKLEKVYISDFPAWCKINFSDTKANPLTYAHRLIKDGKEITEIDFPAELNEVKDCAFTGGYFTRFTFNSDIVSIGKEAFADCLLLNDVELPSSLKNIGEWAFEGCRSLKEIVIPDSVERISELAFSGCLALEKVRLPENITEIKYGTFLSCSSLVDVLIPSKVSKIGEVAFSSCESLTEINLPDALREIDGWAFEQCGNLKSVSIGNSISKIKNYAFLNCYNLENVYINDLENWCEVIFENDYSNPLRYARNLYLDGEEVTSLRIPESVTRIKPYAFYGCSHITTISFPVGFRGLIGEYAFAKCTGLETIYCECQPSTCEENIFPSSVYETAELIVPEGWWGELYREIQPWNKFSHITYYPYAGINKMTGGKEELYTVFSIDGTLILKNAEKENLNQLKPGLYIVNGKKVLIK